MDKIFIRDLTVMTVIGTRPGERLARRPLILNITMQCPLAPAGLSDDLNRSVNYQAVAEMLIDLGLKSNFLLLEAFVEKAAQLILKEFALVQSVTIAVDKPNAIGGAVSVGVEITRTR